MLYICNDNALSFTALCASFIYFEDTSDLKTIYFKTHFHTFGTNIALELYFLDTVRNLLTFHHACILSSLEHVDCATG